MTVTAPPPQAAEVFRSKPTTYYEPEAVKQRTVEHIHHYNYSRPYDWYYTQPYVNVGGGYSSAFWWIMMTEWSVQRRADWLYHNQHRIDQAAYAQAASNAEVQARLRALEAQNAARDPNYVDQEFRNNPELMYDPAYVQTVAQAPAPSQSDGSAGTVLLWLFGALCVIGLIAFATTFRFGK